MKNKKNWITAVAIVAAALLLFSWYTSEKEKDSSSKLIAEALKDSSVTDTSKEALDNAVNEAILGEDSKSDSPVSTLTDAIKDTLNNVNEDSDSKTVSEIINVESSNKLTLKQDGKEISVRLIGVHSNGSKDGLKNLLNNVSDLRIETDTKKTEGEYKLVYLWDGEPKEDCSNMINIQMIKNEYAYSTYDFIHPGVIETPNIKYQSYFIDATK